MKNNRSKITRKYFLILSTLFFLLIITYAFTFLYIKYCNKKIISIILNVQNVLNAEIQHSSGFPLSKELKYIIKIHFNNGGNILVENVNQRGKGDIRLLEVDNYRILSMVFNEQNRQSKGIETNLKLWSAILGFKVTSIIDLTESYFLISKHVKNFPDTSNDLLTEYVYLIDGYIYKPFRCANIIIP